MSYTYYDYAENDYNFIMNNYKSGGVWNSMCSISQQICERYIRHIIDKYYMPDNQNDCVEASEVLRTHNLNKLERFLKKKMSITFEENVHNALTEINGFYFETRYPGDESFFADKEDIENAVNGIKLCKETIDKIIAEKEKQIKENTTEKETEKTTDEEIELE